MRRKQHPWEGIGVSRATWYRHGKPKHKPTRLTQPVKAEMLKISVRAIQRMARVARDFPQLVALISEGKLTLMEAERLRQCKHAGTEDQRAAMAALLAELLDAPSGRGRRPAR